MRKKSKRRAKAKIASATTGKDLVLYSFYTFSAILLIFAVWKSGSYGRHVWVRDARVLSRILDRIPK